MDAGEALTRWTVRTALALYVLALVLRSGASGRVRWLGRARLAWTAGCAAFVLHVVCAFHYYHGWSHAAAYAATAEGTAQVVGLAWGGGLFANYLFTLVWAADVGWWWGGGLGRYERRPRPVEWGVQGFLGFMAFNATVVFGRGPARRFGLACCLLLAAGAGWLRYNRRAETSRPG